MAGAVEVTLRQQVSEFLDGVGLEPLTDQFLSYGVQSLDDLMDLDVMSIVELTTKLGLTQLQARKYHVAVQKALGDAELAQARRESQALLFETASSLHLVDRGSYTSPSKNPVSVANFHRLSENSHMRRQGTLVVVAGISPVEMLENAGLGKYTDQVRALGINTLEDLLDPAILGNQQLLDEVGMTSAEVQAFRHAGEAFQSQIPLAEEDSEVSCVSSSSSSSIASSPAPTRGSVVASRSSLWSRRSSEASGAEDAEPALVVLAAPSGRVSMAFTDIQGSTQLWEHFGRKFKPILDGHHRTLRKCLLRHRGYEVKTEGDAFFVAFPSPVDAVSFALEVQTEMMNVTWPEWLLSNEEVVSHVGEVFDHEAGAVVFRGLRVRIGIMTGEPECEQDSTTGRMDYYGPAVNKAARVEGLAEGGQVLVASEVIHQLPEAMKQSIHVKDLGMVALKGITEPSQIFEVLPKPLENRTFLFKNRALRAAALGEGINTALVKALMDAVVAQDKGAAKDLAHSPDFTRSLRPARAEVLEKAVKLAVETGADDMVKLLEEIGEASGVGPGRAFEEFQAHFVEDDYEEED